MGKSKVTEELLAEWLRLRQKGQSLRNIAKEYGFDPRTVKSWVDRAGGLMERDHWEAVSQEVDGRYLDEHYRLLLQVAVAVLDAAQAIPVVGDDQDAELLLRLRLESAITEVKDLLKGRGVNLERYHAAASGLNTGSGWTVSRLGRKLLDALFEHEPRLKVATERWVECLAGFQQVRKRLIEETEGLTLHLGVSAEIAEVLRQEVLQEALETQLLGKGPCSSKMIPRHDGMVEVFRIWQNGSRMVWRGSPQDAQVFADTCDRVLSLVSHPERMRPVEDAYRRLVECVLAVEDQVDLLVLTGKPQGRCSLCPGRAVRLRSI